VLGRQIFIDPQMGVFMGGGGASSLSKRPLNKTTSWVNSLVPVLRLLENRIMQAVGMDVFRPVIDVEDGDGHLGLFRRKRLPSMPASSWRTSANISRAPAASITAWVYQNGRYNGRRRF